MRQTGLVVLMLTGSLLTGVPEASGADPTWTDVGGGLNDTVFALNTDVPDVLLVGGRFTDAGGVAGADGIAAWDGTSWTALGDGLTSGADAVHTIEYVNGRIYAGGSFPGHLKVWDGDSWNETCGGDPGGPIDALLASGEWLYVGGAFLDAAGAEAVDTVLRCHLPDETAFSMTSGSDDVVGRVKAFAVSDDGFLYAGGEFVDAERDPRNDYIARYDGAHWKNVGQGKEPGTSPISTANVDALASDGTRIYVGTDDDDIADIPEADHLAVWDGFNWSPVGIRPEVFGPQSRINAIALHGDGEVFVTGNFNDAADNARADDIAHFDGFRWHAVGANADGTNGPFVGEGYALAVWQDQLVVGGGFVDAGGDLEADRLAAYSLTVPAPDATVRFTRTPGRTVETERPRIRVRFAWEGTDAVSFVCKLDSAPYRACESPRRMRVDRGRHVFRVAGINADGLRGDAERYSFRVLRPPSRPTGVP